MPAPIKEGGRARNRPAPDPTPAAAATAPRRVGRPPRDPDAERLPIGRRLRAVLDHRRMKHDDLRRLVGVSKSAFSGWVNEKTYPTLEQIVVICRELNISSDSLIGLKPLVLE